MTPEQEARLTELDYQLEQLESDGTDIEHALTMLDCHMTCARFLTPESGRSYYQHVAAALGYSVLLKDALAERDAGKHIVWLPAEVIW